MNLVPHQATCVAIKSRGLLIEGPPGCGKSTLALTLIDRGATLVGDDGVMLEARQGRLWALPPPHITGLLEIRNVGLLNLSAEAAPIALIVHLDPNAPRLPDTVESIALHGIKVPVVRLFPDSPALALRAEWALAMHGTS